jgi:type II secretory pathway pseudopilin PulG
MITVTLPTTLVFDRPLLITILVVGLWIFAAWAVASIVTRRAQRAEQARWDAQDAQDQAETAELLTSVRDHLADLLSTQQTISDTLVEIRDREEN